MNLSSVPTLLKTIAQQRVLVVGDVMLDEFIWGNVSRISPEAPIPIVEVSEENSYPGGAANVARNLIEFTPHVSVLGFIGEDLAGKQLQHLLAASNIATHHLLIAAEFSTIVKTRIIARHQQMVRVDREKRLILTPQLFHTVLTHIEAELPHLDAIIFEDYGKGSITQELKDKICELAEPYSLLTIADPNPRNPITWSNLTSVKPNRAEAFLAAGIPLNHSLIPPLEDTQLLTVGRYLLKKWNIQYLLVTLGEQGMILFMQEENPYYFPAHAQEVFDVSGAGDTVIAIYTLALAAGATPPEAAELANQAAAIVVSKLGTATLTLEELLHCGR